MSWFSENKFVAGLLGVTLVGAGGLGFMLFNAKAAYEENAATFEQQAAELNRLEHLPAYPEQKNFQALEQQRLAHLEAIDALQKQLAGAQIPAEQLTPVQFQDRLKTAVTDFTREAANARMALPGKAGFYLGFEPYSTAPPTPEAAPLLGKQLKAIQLLMSELMKNGVVQLVSFSRETLPEENGSKAKVDAAKAVEGKGKSVAALPLKKTHLDLTIKTEQGSAQRVLNAVVSSPSQFFIPRYLTLENEQKAGPSKLAPPGSPGAFAGTGGVGMPANGDSENPGPASTPAPVDASAATVTPGAPEPKNPIIVGQELVNLNMRLEIVDVTEPAPPAAKGGREAAK